MLFIVNRRKVYKEQLSLMVQKMNKLDPHWKKDKKVLKRIKQAAKKATNNKIKKMNYISSITNYIIYALQ